MVGTEHLKVGHHAVQFYGHDEELAEQVVGYLLEALGNGGVAVVIATPEHRREFEARLRKALGGDADLAAARDSGAYLALDARETVRSLMPAGGWSLLLLAGWTPLLLAGWTPLLLAGWTPLLLAGGLRSCWPADSLLLAGWTPLPSTV